MLHGIELNNQTKKGEVTACVDLRDKNSSHHHSGDVLTKNFIHCDHPCWFFTYFHLSLWEKQVFYACMQSSRNKIWSSSLHRVYLECISISKPHVTVRSHANWLFLLSKQVQYSKFWYIQNLFISYTFFVSRLKIWISVYSQRTEVFLASLFQSLL